MGIGWVVRRGSKAAARTSSTVSTSTNFSRDFTSAGTSTRYFSLGFGRMTCRIPARSAPGNFSLRPPMGRTRPRSVISPVIATCFRTGVAVNSEANAVNIAMPAEGPSFGTAPPGTGTWMSVSLKAPAAMPSSAQRDRTRLRAVSTDSCITSPIWPGRMMAPRPRVRDGTGAKRRIRGGPAHGMGTGGVVGRPCHRSIGKIPSPPG